MVPGPRRTAGSGPVLAFGFFFQLHPFGFGTRQIRLARRQGLGTLGKLYRFFLVKIRLGQEFFQLGDLGLKLFDDRGQFLEAMPLGKRKTRFLAFATVF